MVTGQQMGHIASAGKDITHIRHQTYVGLAVRQKPSLPVPPLHNRVLMGRGPGLGKEGLQKAGFKGWIKISFVKLPFVILEVWRQVKERV